MRDLNVDVDVHVHGAVGLWRLGLGAGVECRASNGKRPAASALTPREEEGGALLVDVGGGGGGVCEVGGLEAVVSARRRETDGRAGAVEV